MIIWAHPPQDDLADYAAGSLSDGWGLLVAGHLTYCPSCRNAVARLETIGGALLCEMPDLAPPSLEATLARLRSAKPRPAETPRPTGEMAALPLPVRRRLADQTAIRWRSLLPGLDECRISDTDGEQVSLFRARPGVTIDAHDHSGDEATLVLRGAMLDAGREFRPGDVARAGSGHLHEPRIIGEETCICLAVISGHRRFTGAMGSLLTFPSR